VNVPQDRSNWCADFQFKGHADGRIICQHWADIVDAILALPIITWWKAVEVS